MDNPALFVLRSLLVMTKEAARRRNPKALADDGVFSKLSKLHRPKPANDSEPAR